MLTQQPSQLTAYMLVNNTGDLNAVRTNTGGTYALGKNIAFGPNDAPTFTTIPNFTGCSTARVKQSPTDHRAERLDHP